MRIVLDAGHSNDTPGKRTPDDSMREFHFNSRVAEIVRANLLSYDGVGVLFTHRPDTDVPLKVRTDQANAWKADLFFSIHANAAGSGGWNDAEGIETFVYTTKPKQALILAAEVQGNLVRETGRSNRGVKTADFHVLRETAMTSVLVECGFMTNKEEATLLKSEDYRQKCAKAITNAIVKAYNLQPKAKGKPTMKAEDANKIIELLKGVYTLVGTKEDRKEIGRLADELRLASGQQPQNK